MRFSVKSNNKDNMMWCRMLFSRACNMAGAFGGMSARLNTER